MLDAAQKRRIMVVFGLMLVNAVLETVSLTLLFPVLQLGMAGGNTGTMPVVQRVIDFLGIGEHRDPLFFLLWLLFGVFIFKNFFVGFFCYYQARVISGIRAGMTTLLLTSYARKPYEKFLFINSSNAVYDIAITAPSIISGILKPALGMLMEISIVIGVLVALVMLDPFGSLVAGGLMGIAMVLFYVLVRRRVYHLGQDMLSAIKQVSHWSHLAIGATKENRILGRNKFFIDKVAYQSTRFARMMAITDLIAQLPRIVGELVILSTMLGVIAFVVVRHGSMESMLPLLGVFAVAAFRVLPSANRIATSATALNQHIAPLEAVYDDILEAVREGPEPAPEAEAAAASLPFSATLQLDKISYRYPGTSEWAIKGAELVIEKGQMVAFVGPSGAGKTTIVDLIMGLLPVTEGKILLDGRPVETGTNFWHGRIGYVPQNIFLADDSLLHNIALGIPDDEIDIGRANEVIEMAQLESVIEEQESGIDTFIGERGIRISGGQRQRIGIARALYADPEILVLDEATSALDTETEKAVNQSITALGRNKTIIVIAHRLSTVALCDRIFFMRDGRIVDAGTFIELQARHRYFQEIGEPEVETGDCSVETGS